ncbi:LuxR family transcriptional regulator [Knoellia sp. p5-6-4]|uniref:helix-turn-helix transcriptional regulator n=1 Tax=unclassified Knoellia TaxID=2618719 RepID=UPI0023DC3D1F|nr:LuxR family transcriptional regulator [Knoellia sp. p5-6-4]MDF2145737.1 AAA family ATPase [Knoellia sp. p5-6-4]
MPLDAPAGGLFVGRDDDCERLSRLLGLDPAAGRTGMVVLSGDAGIGKTRLLTELTAHAREQGWLVLTGHCLGEVGSSLPYLPFTEMLGRLEATAPDQVDAVIGAHPHLARLFPSRRRGGGTDEAGALDRADLVEAVHAALEDLAQQGPVLVVVEDVHWADQSSRDLLSLLFTRGFAGPVSLVASYRSDDLHRRHPLRATLAHWARLASVQRLDLAPLADRHVREIVRGLGGSELGEREVQAVVERAEGNAFFAEELTAASALGRPGSTEDLSRLLLVRFEQLGDAGQQVVRLAAAAGRQVSHRLLSEVVDLSDAELDVAIRDAVEHHVLVPTDTGGYAFRHALLAETVYDDLLPGERVRAHERYAAAFAEDPSLGTWADLARHALAAGHREEALDASARAGDAAMAVGGPEEAWRHYKQALALLADDHPSADSLTVRAAAAATSTGRAYKALDLLQDRLTRRPQLADAAGRAELLGAVATTARLTENPVDTLAVTKEALSLLPPEDQGPLRARLLGAHAQALADRGRDDEATRAGDDAIAVAEQFELRDVADEVRVVLAKVRERTGNPEESQHALERILEDPAVQGTPAESRALHHLGSLHHRAGRLSQALEIYRRGASRARAGGREWAPYALECRLLGGIAAYELGDWAQAEEILAHDGADAPLMARALLDAALLYVAAGRGDTAALDVVPSTRRWWETEGLVALLSGSAAIDLHGDAGDLAAAVAAHDEVVTLLNRLWRPRFQARVRLSALLLGQLASHAATTAGAARHELLVRGEELAAVAREVWQESDASGNGGPEASAWAARAEAELLRLRWLTGADPGQADLEGAWSEAVRRFEGYGHAFEGARSRARLAAVLSAGGDPRAEAEAAAATETATRLGARPLLAELRPLTGHRPPLRDAAARPAEHLTPREHEILSLVALGRSNKQIGTQLFISAKTASVHVSNIMAKLGATGRGEAVAVARQRGLLD